jgi:hypothetical protein
MVNDNRLYSVFKPDCVALSAQYITLLIHVSLHPSSLLT